MALMPVSAGAGALDPVFGQAGRVTAKASTKPIKLFYTLMLNSQREPATAVSKDGTIALGLGHTIVQLNPDGSRNLDFGRRGRLQLAAGAGHQFQISAISFDSAGRLLVAGTTAGDPLQFVPKVLDFPTPTRVWATVRRYLPNGRPDRQFGSGGWVETDLGLPAAETPPVRDNPTIPTGTVLNYEAPSLSVSGLTVDSQDRPIVTGAVVTKVAYCYSGDKQLTNGYVARLSVNGALDQSFGTGGNVLDPVAVQAENPTIDRFGRIIFTGPITNACSRFGGDEEAEVVALDNGGQPDQSFGTTGRTRLANIRPLSSTVDRKGRILLLGRYITDQATHLYNRVLRVTARGLLDPTFGRGGMTTFVSPEKRDLSGLGVDGKGRPLLVGFANSMHHHDAFLLQRMRARGGFDRTFGRRGSIVTGFDRAGDAAARHAIAYGNGSILVTGTITGAGPSPLDGIAIARYSGKR